MKHILHVITSPCAGGAELVVRELVKTGAPEIPSASGIYFNNWAPCAQDVRLRDNEMLLNVGYRDLRAIFRLRAKFKELLSKDIDLIVHAHLTSAFYFVPIAALGLNISLLYTEHANTNRRRRLWFLKYVEKLFYSQYRKIVCISNASKKELIRWIGSGFDESIDVIHNGARNYVKRNQILPNDSHIRFISVGSLIDDKGFDRTIRALSRLRDTEWSYIIVGVGPLKNSLKALVSELGIVEKVKFVGWVDNPEVEYLNADIQLIPSRVEGFGLVAVEGLSTGLPIVASNIQGLNEVLSQGPPSSFLVEKPDDESCWVEQISKCIVTLKNERSNVVNHARARAELFTISEMARKYGSLWNKI